MLAGAETCQPQRFMRHRRGRDNDAINPGFSRHAFAIRQDNQARMLAADCVRFVAAGCRHRDELRMCDATNGAPPQLSCDVGADQSNAEWLFGNRF
jgi:hypothetical protein